MKTADLVIKSKAIYTGKQELPQEGAIVVRDGRILDLCSYQEVGKYQCDPANVWTVEEGMVLPGFIDAHTHVLATAASESVEILDLTEAHSQQECVERIQVYLRKNPDADRVIGNGWSTAVWDQDALPDRKLLDENFPDIPIILSSFDGHTCWLNGKALQVCGITKHTTVKFGEIQKYPDGRPTGILCDIAAISLAAKQTAAPSAETIKRNLNYFSSKGITSIADVSATPMLEEEPAEYAPLLSLKKETCLPVRLHLYPSLGDNGDFALAEQLAEKYCYSDLQVCGLKQFVDGTTSVYSAALVQEYADKPGELGCVNYPEPVYKELVTKANEKGFSVKLHAIGDRGVRVALDAFEYAKEASEKAPEKGREVGKTATEAFACAPSEPTHIRNCIEHVENLLKQDEKRFAESKVIASMQPEHLLLDNMEKSIRLGTERAKTIWPFRRLLDAGAVLAFGSDYPVVDCDPIQGIHAAVSRTFPGGRAATTCQEEKITLKEAIDAFTQGSAYSIGRDHELGTLEPGKLADLVVLDKNLFTLEPEKLLETKAIMTVTGGSIVYRAYEEADMKADEKSNPAASKTNTQSSK